MKDNPIISDHQPDYQHEWDCSCARCGSSIERERCEDCGGEGVSGHDCGEDCCACLYPEDNIPCDTCNGMGGWWQCLSSADWCEANPLPGRENVPRGKVEWFIVAQDSAMREAGVSAERFRRETTAEFQHVGRGQA